MALELRLPESSQNEKGLLCCLVEKEKFPAWFSLRMGLFSWVLWLKTPSLLLLN
jgi:hypothetical protein